MAQQNQFKLLYKRRFLPLLLSLTTAAFNDNLFKNALLVMFAFRLVEREANILINLATGFYILPYFLFSVTAGQLADKYDKSRIIRLLKLAEIFIVLLGAYALLNDNRALNFSVLFLLATHTAIFSPVQYALLPQHLKRAELMGGNGLAQMGSFAGVLSGTIVGTLLAGYTTPGEPGLLFLGLIMVLVAVFGYLASRAIPVASPSTPELRIDWNPISQAWRILHRTMKTPSVFYAIIACSWFWLVSSAYLAQVPSFTKNVLGASEPVITIILCCLSIGVAVGSLMCERLSRGRITFGIVPIGGLGMTIAGLGLGLTATEFQTLSGASVEEYLQSDGAYAILIYTALLGIFGGIYIVPLYTIMQDRAEKTVRAQILSINNVINAFFIVVISLLNVAFLEGLKLTIPQLFILIALLNVLAMLFLFIKLPEFVVHLLTWLASHLWARTSSENLEHIPESGAALISCSPVDTLAPLLLMDTVPRPIRFILPRELYEAPFLRFVFKNYGVAPIIYETENDCEITSGSIEQAVLNGELLCYFANNSERYSCNPPQEAGEENVESCTALPVLPILLKGLERNTEKNTPTAASPLKRLPFTRVHIKVGEPVLINGIKSGALHYELSQMYKRQP
ncbi:MFS transporter [Microbulbifer epialgicus]|uniref:MFS transporter n=1 Tax=Microbulbifer epialgicus TaxID=393907 RepID=A0ABV4NYY8_9GAMM